MLVSMQSLMAHAKAHQYAVGYFESWNLESMLAVKDAAEALNAPVIIGVNGTFVGNPERRVPEEIAHYAKLGRAIAENAKVPMALLLNEAEDENILIRGLREGFNAIMYAEEGAPLDKTVAVNQYIVRAAHACGAAVEAEVGELPTADIAKGTLSQGELTDPDQAAWFVRETNVDALAVAVGNVHLLEGRTSSLNFALIEELAHRVSVPLVLHGGTGVSEPDFRRAIELGMCKVNVGTVMKRAWLDTIRAYLGSHDVDHMDPHDVIGKGGDLDVLMAARQAVMDTVVRFMRIIGCEGQAGKRGM